MKKKVTYYERFKYWCDRQMSKGSFSLIKLLSVFTVFSVLLLTGIGVILGLAKNGLFPLFWDSIATIINFWLPYYDEGNGNIPYLILMAFGAIIGLLVASVLIGIIGNVIEDKIAYLKNGNSRIIENDHYVILGFTPGEYTLIQQLIIAAGKSKRVIVIADEMERAEMRENILDNIDFPRNVRLLCRSVDLLDPVSLQKLSLDTCRSIIISPTDDKRTTKILLAVSRIINEVDNNQVRVGAIISKEEYFFPRSIAKKHNVTELQTNDVIAKIIAHSCTRPGLSETFREIFNFEGSEFYSLMMPTVEGLTFWDLSSLLDAGTPVGFIREEKTYLNPAKDTLLHGSDRILVFAEERTSPILKENHHVSNITGDFHMHKPAPVGKIVLLGYNDSLETIIHELPSNVTELTAACKKKYRDTIRSIAADEEMRIQLYEKDLQEEGAMLKIAEDAAHIVLLSDHDMDEDDADMKIIFRIMQLRDLRDRYNLHFNITAEMRKEKNQNLIQEDDHIDFVVASNMSSLILAQLAESPELLDAFQELLSIEGNEFYIKTAHEMDCVGYYTALELRQIMLMHNHIFIGHINDTDYNSVFNSPLTQKIHLEENTRLIVMGAAS